MVDAQRLKDSFALVARHGDEVPLFFYSNLFLSHPETRDMFPVGMAHQRDKLVNALGRVISNVDNLDELAPFLQQLGRDHRKFAVAADHYPAVGAALLYTLEHFLGPEWTPELAADWEAAFGLVAQVMQDAAAAAEASSPPWWSAEVTSVDRRTLDVAVIQARTSEPIGYQAGQSLALETEMRPRIWRYYSPAHAERADGLVEFHVRLIAGGPVSPALVQALQPGDFLRLGAPVGRCLTLHGRTEGDLVLVAGGTGLAPLRALLDQLLREDAMGAETVRPRRVVLFHGGRNSADLYDLPALSGLAERTPWLSVVPVVSDDMGYSGGERGLAVEAALRFGPWVDPQVYVCGSPGMVTGSVERLLAAGLPPTAIHTEDFGNDFYGGTDGIRIGNGGTASDGEEATHDLANRTP